MSDRVILVLGGEEVCGSREWHLGVVSFCAWRALILWYASTNIRLTATAAFIHCVYVCHYEGMRDWMSQYQQSLLQKMYGGTSNEVDKFHNPDFSSGFHKTDDGVDAETFLPDFLE